jgi:uncharacterized repeat protein (TIGR03803 family)
MRTSRLPVAVLFAITCVPVGVAQGATQSAADQASPSSPSVQEVILYSFSGKNDGGAPSAAMTFDSKGNLYGTTNQGGVGLGGTVFKLTSSSNGWEESTLYSFTGGKDGGFPGPGTLIFDYEGNIYGTTIGGGTYGFGTVFELKPEPNNAWKEKVLYSFKGSKKGDGQQPWAGVTSDESGNLYGTTELGGHASTTCPSGCGTVFKLTHSGSVWTEALIYNFKGKQDGAGVPAGVIADKGGNLYGTTSEGGGVGNFGTVFKLAQTKGVWKEQVLHRFTGGDDGGSPYAGLTLDSAENLYGTTFYGGTSGYGTVFKLSKTGWRETVLQNFAASTDGGFPYYGTLIFDKAGNLYGTTSVGGCCADGIAFELSPSEEQWTETVLFSFSGEDGWEPNAGLNFDALGNLYGTTSGGAGLGSCSDI